ncbi:hypothetical protein BDQ17DRAFT_1431998 [Cyathus striatus]|nr:hypothetical protein BDQ17DRAFT_1431998 [Cyathus striatus]
MAMIATLAQQRSDVIIYGPTFYQGVGQVQILTPMMLIYRIIQGKLYNSQTIAHITQIRFNNDDVAESNLQM